MDKFDYFLENKYRTHCFYYDDAMGGAQDGSEKRRVAIDKLYDACCMGVSKSLELYHYMPFEFFVAMISKKELQLDKPKPFSPVDEDITLPDVVVNKATGELASLAQIKETSYVKCFSEDANSTKLWDKACVSCYAPESAICFRTTPVALMDSMIDDADKYWPLNFSFLKVQYKDWQYIGNRLTQEVLADADWLTTRRYESIATLPSTDRNGEETSYMAEREVRFVIDELGEPQAQTGKWYKLSDLDFIKGVCVWVRGGDKYIDLAKIISEYGIAQALISERHN